MAESIELEIGLSQDWDVEHFRGELRLRDPNDGQESSPETARLSFRFQQLTEQVDKPAEYGRILSDDLFAASEFKDCFRRARDMSDRRGAPLRIRLRIDRSAPRLNRLLWETLVDPFTGTFIATNQNTYFCRYLARLDFRQTRLKPQGKLKAVIAVAAPSDLETYNLAPVDVAAETALAQQALGDIECKSVAAEGQRVTLGNLIAALRAGCDVLYLVCHGRSVEGETWLYLEGQDGRSDLVRGSDLVAPLADLQSRPLLVVLCACQSSGNFQAADGALAAVGPRLGEAGIPAVIAMQGNLPFPTAEAFFPQFFRELARHGQVDLAMSVARRAAMEAARARAPLGTETVPMDSFMPVLFMRLVRGRIWYVPGFGESPKDFFSWPTLLSNLSEGKCTPILGCGLLEPMIGSTREIAWRLARSNGYPSSAEHQDRLPQVAQFIATTGNRGTSVADLVRTEVSRQLIRRYGTCIPKALKGFSPEEWLKDAAVGGQMENLLQAVWALRCANQAGEPYRILAELPFPRYICTSPDGLLELALKSKTPTARVPVRLTRNWRRGSWASSTQEANYTPTVECPLVAYLFGSFEEPDDLVLSEDDYFDYLIKTSQAPVDTVTRAGLEVNTALVDTSLLFLGFRQDDWDFRTLFRSIQMMGGKGRNRQNDHVAVQVDPQDQTSATDGDRLRKFLEQYFEPAKVHIFWGSGEDFLTELSRRWNSCPAASPAATDGRI